MRRSLLILLPILKAEPFLDLYTNKILFTNSTYSRIDCSYSDDPICAAACTDLCADYQPVGTQSYPSCLQDMPIGCQARLEGTLIQGTTGCNKIRYESPVSEKTYYNTITFPILWEGLSRLEDSIDKIEVMLQSNSLLDSMRPTNCAVTAILVQVGAQCMLEDRWRSNANSADSISYEDDWWILDITNGYMTDIKTTSKGLSALRYISLGDTSAAVTSCLGLTSLLPDYANFWATRITWSEVFTSLERQHGYEYSQLDDTCLSATTCGACKTISGCGWCMTAWGQMCSPECLNGGSEMSRQILDCAAISRFAPLTLFLLTPIFI